MGVHRRDGGRAGRPNLCDDRRRAPPRGAGFFRARPARATALFGPPDQTRTLQWRVHDPDRRRQGLQTVEVLMWKPRQPVGAAE